VVTAFLALTVVAISFAALWSAQTTILACWSRSRSAHLACRYPANPASAVASSPARSDDIVRSPYVICVADAIVILSCGHPADSAAVGRRGQGSRHHGRATPAGGTGRSCVTGPIRFFIFGLVLTTFGYAQIEVGFTAFSSQVAHAAPRIIGWAFAATRWSSWWRSSLSCGG
jgi:hypothetical protein